MNTSQLSKYAPEAQRMADMQFSKARQLTAAWDDFEPVANASEKELTVAFKELADHVGALGDPGAYNECREPNTEWVADRERANRCEYFTPGDLGGGEAASEAAAAKAKLQDLFKR